MGVIDLSRLKSYIWPDGCLGAEYEVGDTLTHMAEPSEQAASADRKLCRVPTSRSRSTSAEDQISIEERSRSAVRNWAPIATAWCRCFCGSAFKDKGVQNLLDAVVDYLPARPTCRRSSGTPRGPVRRSSAACMQRRAAGALAFKTVMTDPFGDLTFVRIYSGILKQGVR
jgi:elongation factor G